MSLATAVWSRLAVDPVLAAKLATYRGGPAVVVADEDTVPEDMGLPFVAITGVAFDEPNDAKVEGGREQELVIRIYTASTGSTLLVDELAERVRSLLHRLPSGLADGAYIARCSGPVVAPTDASLYGREVTVRVTSLITTNPPTTEES